MFTCSIHWCRTRSSGVGSFGSRQPQCKRRLVAQNNNNNSRFFWFNIFVLFEVFGISEIYIIGYRYRLLLNKVQYGMYY